MSGIDFWATAATSYLLIFAAEIGDKSQLVCMMLAARHRGSPVLLGSALAFALLNALAVIFGVALARWIPDALIFSVVAVLFLLFGIQALRATGDQDEACVNAPSTQGLFWATFALIFVAEFGDKTQLAVVGLASTSLAFPVWLGATAALVSTSALGIWAGCTLLQRMPLALLHRISGGFFILLALVAAYKALGAAGMY